MLQFGPAGAWRVRTYRGLRVVDLVDERGEAEDVAEQDELVLVVRALLAGAREELDGVEPFVVSE